MSVLSTIAKGAAKVFVKKVTTVDPEGEEKTKLQAREGIKGIGWIIAFLLAWHFIIQPILVHLFPECAFPALDCGWLGTLLLEL